jgi:O-antigen/teichoic acid export membrane protein
VVRGASVAFATRLGGAAAKVGQDLAVARLLGPSDSGAFFLAVTVATVASTAARLGLDNTVVRFSASCVAQDDWPGVRGVGRRSMAITVIGAAATTVALLFGAQALGTRVFHDPSLAPALVAMALSVVPTSAYTIYGQLLKGIGRIGEGVFVLTAAAPAIATLLTLVLAPAWGLMGAVVAYSAAAIGAWVLGVARWNRAVTAEKRPFPMSDLLRSGLPLWVHSLLQLVIRHGALVMLGIFATKSEVGIFAIALRAAFAVSSVLVAVNATAAPRFSALHSTGDLETLRRTAQGSTFLMCLVSGPVLAAFVLFPGQILRLYSPEFAGGGALLAILAVGQFVNVATGSVQMLLMMTDQEDWIMRTTVLSAALALFLNIALIPRWGPKGAAIATSVVWIVQNLLVLVTVRWKLGFWVTPSPRAWRGTAL